jgi:predicted  nucleic acid-binding Zn-ribbon protein
LSVAPDATEHLTLEEHHPENTQIELNDLDEKQVTLLVENQSLTPAAQQALRKVLDQKNQVDVLENEISSRQHEIDAISKDQARVRENMKALKGSVEEKALLQRYARQLDQQEDRLNNLQREINDLTGKKAQADADLDRIVQAIAMDESL